MEQVFDDSTDLYHRLSIAIRHIARHRGWRNPYATVAALLANQEPSEEYQEFIEKLNERLPFTNLSPDMTLAQVVLEWQRTDITRRLRSSQFDAKGSPINGKEGALFAAKLRQVDQVRELRQIWATQGLPEDQFRAIVETVFQQKSPKGSAAGRIAKDPLPGMSKYRRASKASLAFQRFRVVSIVANLRIQDGPEKRCLTVAERTAAISYLWDTPSDAVSWDGVAEALNLPRAALRGTAEMTVDGERAGAKPPVNATAARIRLTKIKSLIEYWDDATIVEREGLIDALSNGTVENEDDAIMEAVAQAEEFLASLSAEDQAKVEESLKLPEGRAAYSRQSLELLTKRMEGTEDDLHAARVAQFNVPDDWQPPAEPIGQPVGNPAVDRTTKIVARWLAGVEARWGAPISLNVESTRDGLISEATARKLDKENNQRAKERQAARADFARFLAAHQHEPGVALTATGDTVSGETNVSQRDLARYQAFTRQDGMCLYCGTPLHFKVMELDHIVPRAGQGSNNRRENLAAVCAPCNQSKKKLPFAVWATSPTCREGVDLNETITRVKQFFGTGKKTKEQLNFIRAMIARLQRSEEDEALDTRSIESVGWMANELRSRIEAHYREIGADTKVGLFRGWVTSEARKASGVENQLRLIGGATGKNRLDRRHHAVDAVTIAMLRPGVEQTLVLRDNLRKSQNLVGKQGNEPEWKQVGLDQPLFVEWKQNMAALAALLQLALDDDAVPVFELLRLRLGSSQGHEATIQKLPSDSWLPVSSELPMELIDRSATPAQWVALTRSADFEAGIGLPANPQRTITVSGQRLGPDDSLPFFPTASGCIAVRGGWAELGASFHHARIYRCRKPMKSGKFSEFFAMMRVYQVDLLRQRKANLFTVDLPPQSISRRAAEQRLRDALDAGQAEYIGWLVPGDELQLNLPPDEKGQVGELLQAYPGTQRWVVAGFFAEAKLRLRPRLLAGEGIAEDSPDGVKKILNGPGWCPAVNQVFGSYEAVVIRRNILGEVRDRSSHGLPTSWSVDRPGL
ncbi:MAG: HNH endonuclease [Bifidobacteriaceae bacterium]|jgi:CRISPR-associated endonuclease Csn1|nr:HNH endonuclease [Bifidobacteriaceae bacterium]